MNAPAEYLECAWLGNPFNSDAARRHSAYSGWTADGPVRLLDTGAPGTFASIAHAAFRGFVLDPAFPCLGARAAISRGTYRFGAYESLDDRDVTEGLARDLYAFVLERKGFESVFTSFIAVFKTPLMEDERDFEGALWAQLQRLHDLDAQFHTWDDRVSNDPHDDAFSFSFAGNAFFVVGLHPHSSRPGRRFAWNALVFNAHEQFEELREDGRFAGLQRQIRRRDIALSGSLNPMIADYGKTSEATQYSGRAIEDGWRCPFSTKAPSK